MTTPVAFIIFNRPDTTEKVFAEIRRARPPRLYIIADGPRSSEEKELTDATRAVVSRIDWDCSVHEIFSNENLGCRQRVITGLNEVFKQEEEAIILEDDCLPDPSFFTFCEALLQRYKYDHSVMHIGGNNFQFGQKVGDGDYYFSQYSHIWGWATWKRAWQYYQPHIYNQNDLIQHILPEVVNKDPKQVDYWHKIARMIERPGYTAWSYHWLFTIWARRAKSIIPNYNLVYNIGFDGIATHTKRRPAWYDSFRLESINSIRAPSDETIDMEADYRTFYRIFYSPQRKLSNWQILKNKIKILIGRVN
jgi:hypothetical protein